jgi:hypothetical protein
MKDWRKKMGAWGHKPMENDYALDWVASNCEQPLVNAIKNALQSFLSESSYDDVKKHEAEAAVALLIDYSGTETQRKFSNINITHYANEGRLWDQAANVVKRLKEDQEWIGDWNSPEEKIMVLNGLLSDLDSLKKSTEQR